MKISIRISAVLIILTASTWSSFATETTLTEQYKEDVIKKLSSLMNDYYVFPEVAKATEVHLNSLWKRGHFDPFDDQVNFAEALTAAVQQINKDKHMRIRVNPPYDAQENTPDRWFEEQMHYIDHSRGAHDGFHAVRILEGNVGYVDLREFSRLDQGKSSADACMRLISGSDALIIDVRNNGGGDPEMVQYLCSYFFDKHVHLNSLYWRGNNETVEFWTLDKVDGDRMPEVPLFVLTSDYTFSAAEEFSYNLQTQERAILIGQTTGGGANPGETMPINENLNVFIPTGKAINPITKTNWEGTGVVPDIKVDQGDPLVKAHGLAKKSAETFRKEVREDYHRLYMNLQAGLENYEAEKSDSSILRSLATCKDVGFMKEFEINMLGYDYLVTRQKPLVAQVVFKVNTQLYPNSANAHDSYAESLMATGNVQSARRLYQKAVDLATVNDDPNLALFKRNLETSLKDAEGN